MQLGARGETGAALFTLPRTTQDISFVPRERAFSWFGRSRAATNPRGRADERYIDVSYEPFFVDLAQRMQLNLIGGDAPQVDPAHMPGVSPRMGVRAQTLIGFAGLHQGIPTALELWQSDTARAISRTRIRTDLVFRVHTDLRLPHTLLVPGGAAGAAARQTLEPNFECEQQIVLPRFLAAALTLTAEGAAVAAVGTTAEGAAVAAAETTTEGATDGSDEVAVVRAARELWDDDVLAELVELAPQSEPQTAIETYGQDVYVSMPAVPLPATSALNRFLATAERVTQAVLDFS